MNTRKKSRSSTSTRGGTSADHAKAGSMSHKGKAKKSSGSASSSEPRFSPGSYSGSSTSSGNKW